MKELKAYCSSRICTNNKFKQVMKDVPRGTDNCPDCNRALFWNPYKSTYYGKKKHKLKDHVEVDTFKTASSL